LKQILLFVFSKLAKRLENNLNRVMCLLFFLNTTMTIQGSWE
jgi:hypothetical protein